MFHKDGHVCQCVLCEKGEKRGAKKAPAGETGGVQPRAPAAKGPNEEDGGEEELWQGAELAEIAAWKRHSFRPPYQQICQRSFNQSINSSFNRVFRSQFLSVITDCSIFLYWAHHSLCLLCSLHTLPHAYLHLLAFGSGPLFLLWRSLAFDPRWSQALNFSVLLIQATMPKTIYRGSLEAFQTHYFQLERRPRWVVFSHSQDSPARDRARTITQIPRARQVFQGRSRFRPKDERAGYAGSWAVWSKRVFYVCFKGRLVNRVFLLPEKEPSECL